MKKLIKAIFIIALVALAGVGVVTIGNSLGIVDKIKSEIDKHTSSLCEHEWVDATCELPRTCDKCGKTKGDPLGHDFIAGVCYRCGAIEGASDGGEDSSSALPDSSINPDISVPDDCEHDWQPATCLSPQTCSKCGAIYGTAGEHTPSGWIEEKAATCQNSGTMIIRCTVCGLIMQTQEIAKTSHTYDEGKVVTQPTEMQDGLKRYTCTVCGATEDQTIPSSGHTHKYSIAWYYNEEGHFKKCSCGETTQPEKHEYTSYITRYSTCTLAGEEKHECSYCKYSYTSQLPLSAHTAGDWIIDKEATCKEQGAKHKECTLCGEAVESGIIAAKGHYGELIWSKNYNSHYMVYSCCYEQATTAENHTKVNGICTVCGFSPTVTVESVEVTQNEKQVKLVLSILDNPGITGLLATVRYNSDVLELTEANSGEALSALTFTSPSVLKSGCTFLWDGVEIQDKDIKDGEFLILTFKISENVPDGEYIVSLNFSAYDNNLNQIALNITDGKITIKNK